MSPKKQLIEVYMDGFRESDHAKVLDCLTEDVVWHIHGYKTLHGTQEFDQEIVSPAFTGNPTLVVRLMVEEGDHVIITGMGSGSLKQGGVLTFDFATHFEFRGGLIAKVESFAVPTNPDA